MPTPAREPFIAYLLVHPAVLRRRRDVTSGAVERLQKHAQALELLAELIRGLPEDDERLLMLATLAVRDGQFVPGPAAEHALTQFAGTSREACDAFLDNLVRTARDDALARIDDARAGDVTFLSNPKYASRLATTRSSASCAIALTTEV